MSSEFGFEEADLGVIQLSEGSSPCPTCCQWKRASCNVMRKGISGDLHVSGIYLRKIKPLSFLGPLPLRPAMEEVQLCP